MTDTLIAPDSQATAPSAPARSYPALTARDRCDAAAITGTKGGGTSRGACGAQAFIRAVLKSGNDLLFCGHHGNEVLPQLVSLGADIQDQRETINLRPTDAKASKGF